MKKIKKFLSAIGKKNIIIISGILLIGFAVYLNLTLQLGETPDITANDGGGREYDDERVWGQASLVDNMNFASEDMGAGMGEAGMGIDVDGLLAGEVSTDAYFAMTVVSRRRARDEALELLSNIVNSAEVMPDTRDSAMREIQTMAREIEQEANIEILVRAKGFEECVAVINGENANIIVKTDGLMPNEIAQIKEIVFEQSGISPRNVKIVERN
jgi:stage III sporulation protein AH